MSSAHLSFLPEDIRRWLDTKVQAEGLDSVETYLSDLLTRLREIESQEDEEIRASIAEGLAELDRGEGIASERVFTELRADHARRFGSSAED